jgi:hypothetical protein
MRYVAAIVGFIVTMGALTVAGGELATPSYISFLKRYSWAKPLVGLAMLVAAILVAVVAFRLVG